jgi:hypothetical protein
MAHKHLTYLDIPAVRRRQTASKTLGRLKESMANPTLTEEQSAALKAKINRISQWASGTIPPTEHVVEVAEEVGVEEDV